MAGSMNPILSLRIVSTKCVSFTPYFRAFSRASVSMRSGVQTMAGVSAACTTGTVSIGGTGVKAMNGKKSNENIGYARIEPKNALPVPDSIACSAASASDEMRAAMTGLKKARCSTAPR